LSLTTPFINLAINSQAVSGCATNTPQFSYGLSPELEVEVRGLPQGALSFLSTLQQVHTLGRRAAPRPGLLSNPALISQQRQRRPCQRSVFTEFKTNKKNSLGNFHENA